MPSMQASADESSFPRGVTQLRNYGQLANIFPNRMTLNLTAGRRFWSVTVYKDGDRLFYPDALYNKANNTDRYNINDRTQGVDFSGGKNFTIYLSATPPPVESKVYKNWIPIGKVPDSKFAVYLRLYGPDEAILNGTSYLPPVIAHKGTWGEPVLIAGV
jgi:hypothetical protein